MQWPYGIGLDIGVASVGWAVLALDENAQPCGIIKLGSRVFPAAEHPQTGESLAAPRRMARSTRRRLRRKALRKADIYRLLPQYGLPDQQQMAGLFAAGHLGDIYALRARALDEPVPPEAFARILLHLAQRRGFKSNRLSEAGGEDGKLLGAVQANAARMAEHGWRTPGEMYCKDSLFAEHKRNKTEDYLATVSREAVLDEACQLFAAQRQFGQAWATPEFEAEYLAVLSRQRTFDEGPGGDSPYRGGWADRVGPCTLEPGEKRAPKNSASFERFNLLQKLNHIRVVQDGVTRSLNDTERAAAVALAYKTESVDYARLRKALALSDEIQFAEVHYLPDKTAAECEKKYKLPPLKGWHALRKALGAAALAELTAQQQDDIAQVLFLYRNEDTRREKLTALGLSAEQAETLLGVRFAKTGHLSVKACRKLIPFLEQGLTYDKACEQAGYDFRAHAGKAKQHLLPATAPELDDITNPVVRRAVRQSIKVVNAIIREQGHSPVYCHIELARELSHNLNARKQMTRDIEANAAQNERLMAEIRETFGLLQPTGQDLVKYRLWKEQGEICAYSQQHLERARLFEPGYAEVDHIVPYSISFDDTRANKVLVLAAENRQKGNRLPLQYLQGEKRERFIAWVQTQVRNDRKRRNLLKQNWTEEEAEGFRQRNLQDTQYMARFLLNFIRDRLEFEPHSKTKQQVVALSGAITAHLRKRWGLGKVRADGDAHHALDAVVIACATQGMVQQVSRWYGRIEGEYQQAADGSGSVHSRTKEHFPAPWPHFRDELITRLSACPQENLLALNPMFYENFPVSSIRPVFVSRMPRHKISGEAHEATVRSPKGGEGWVISKVALTKLKLDKDGGIENYYKPSSDRLLYEALCARLQEYGGDAKKAFAEPFYKPKSDGTPGHLVRKVKIMEKATLTVPVHGGRGLATNGDMVRIDVFFVPGDGYYWVPVYVADILKPELPDRAVVQGKPYTEWKKMREEDFLFSIYPNDLVEVEHKNGIKFTLVNEESTLEKEFTTRKTLVYFIKAKISGGTITVETPEGAYYIPSLGVKTLLGLKKYQVDVLGNVSAVKKETRQRFR